VSKNRIHGSNASSLRQGPPVADEDAGNIRTTSMMDDCNVRALTPLRKSSIAVLSPRLTFPHQSSPPPGKVSPYTGPPRTLEALTFWAAGQALLLPSAAGGEGWGPSRVVPRACAAPGLLQLGKVDLRRKERPRVGSAMNRTMRGRSPAVRWPLLDCCNSAIWNYLLQVPRTCVAPG
jgi:hypothetical protein